MELFKLASRVLVSLLADASVSVDAGPCFVTDYMHDEGFVEAGLQHIRLRNTPEIMKSKVGSTDEGASVLPCVSIRLDGFAESMDNPGRVWEVGLVENKG